MPQHIQHSLIHVLLLWTTILTIVQVVSVVLFFKVERFNQCQNCSAVAQEPKMRIHEKNDTWSPPEFPLAMGKMANFECKRVHPNKTIYWEDDSSSGLLSEGYVLNVLQDGYYFLSLRVTLECDRTNLPGQQLGNISLKTDKKDILQGWIDAQTCSTGVLSKVEKLAATSTLKVTINSSQTTVKEEGSFTHLSVIYMDNPSTRG